MRVSPYAETLSSFFFLSTLRDKWSRASKTERENKEKESCCEMLSILTLLLPHLGHLFFRCHPSCQWQMTQPQSGGSGRQSPGTHSPQAKLVQDLVHLLATPSSLFLPPPIQSIQCPTSLTSFTWLLVSWFHSIPCSGTFLSSSLLFSFFFFLWDAVWLRTPASVGERVKYVRAWCPARGGVV